MKPELRVLVIKGTFAFTYKEVARSTSTMTGVASPDETEKNALVALLEAEQNANAGVGRLHLSVDAIS